MPSTILLHHPFEIDAQESVKHKDIVETLVIRNNDIGLLAINVFIDGTQFVKGFGEGLATA